VFPQDLHALVATLASILRSTFSFIIPPLRLNARHHQIDCIVLRGEQAITGGARCEYIRF
jgi:hypothetical protein